MTQAIFVELTTLDRSLVDVLQILSENFDIIVFTNENEASRMEITDRLIEQDVPCETLLMRADNDYRKTPNLYQSFVVDYFNGHDEKALDKTFMIVCNHVPSIEVFREDGFFVIQTGWD